MTDEPPRVVQCFEPVIERGDRIRIGECLRVPSIAIRDCFNCSLGVVEGLGDVCFNLVRRKRGPADFEIFL